MCDIMVCGDGINNIEMYQTAGIGVAVWNAMDEVKLIADYVSEYSYVNGVVDARFQE